MPPVKPGSLMNHVGTVTSFVFNLDYSVLTIWLSPISHPMGSFTVKWFTTEPFVGSIRGGPI